jgi:hypothetical protein
MTRLEEIFGIANSRYFRSRLKNVKIRWQKKSKMPPRAVGNTRSEYGRLPKGSRKFEIWISDDLKKFSSFTIMTIIHEMVHCEQWDKTTGKTCHGRLFNKRMKQLANLGAFNGLW